MSLTARAIEAAGIPTVSMGCAKDIVEYVGVPRLLFSDFPLGNTAGRPHDPESQRQTLESALALLESASAPMTTAQNPLRWPGNGEWKADFSNVEQMTPEEIAQRRAEFDKGKEIARAKRDEAAA